MWYNKNTTKENNMDETVNGMFNGLFKRVGSEMCRLGVNGDIAVKTGGHDGNPIVYKTYNVESGRLTNVTQFCFNVGQEFFFVMPTTKAKKGDILLIDNHPKCVIENNDNKTIKVMDYENSAIQEIVPERHIFMGQTYFYRKIVSMFGTGSFLKGSKGMGKMMKLMLMKQLFGGLFGGGSGGNDMMNSMLPMMMMGNMFGNNDKDNNGFGDFGEMFDLDFNFDDDAEDEEDDDKKKKE